MPVVTELSLDWPRLVKLLDLDDAETPDDRILILQERRRDELESVASTRRQLSSAEPIVERGHLEVLKALRLADIATIEEALTSVGAPYGLPEDEA